MGSEEFPRAALLQVTPGNSSGIHTQWAAARLPATGLTCHWLDLPLGSGPLHGGGEGTEKGEGGFFPRSSTGDLCEPSVWDKRRRLADTAICWSPVMCATTTPQLLFCISGAFHGGKAGRAEGLRVSRARFTESAFPFLSHFGRCQGLGFSSHGEVSPYERVCHTLHPLPLKPLALVQLWPQRQPSGTESEHTEGRKQKGQDRDWRQQVHRHAESTGQEGPLIETPRASTGLGAEAQISGYY